MNKPDRSQWVLILVTDTPKKLIAYYICLSAVGKNEAEKGLRSLGRGGWCCIFNKLAWANLSEKLRSEQRLEEVRE